MPVLDLQRRMRTVGKIRMGDRGEKGNPQRLKQWRITSADRFALECAAQIYGGEVRAWAEPKQEGQWELYTEAEELNVVLAREVAPSQWYEEWSAGGCQHRCDGSNDTITEAPCTCDPDARKCKLTTRVSVYLPELPALGVFMLESHGYYAATELMGSVDMVLGLEQAQGQRLPMRLAIEPRTTVKDGLTRRYVVPVLRVSGSLAALLTGRGSQQLAEMASRAGLDGNVSQAIGAAPARAAIEAEKSAPAGVNQQTGEVTDVPPKATAGNGTEPAGDSKCPPATAAPTPKASASKTGPSGRPLWEGPEKQCPKCHAPQGKEHARKCDHATAAAPVPSTTEAPVTITGQTGVTAQESELVPAAPAAAAAPLPDTSGCLWLGKGCCADCGALTGSRHKRDCAMLSRNHGETPPTAEPVVHTNVRPDGTVATFGEDDYDPFADDLPALVPG